MSAMTNNTDLHPDFVNLSNDDLRAIAADPCITDHVRGYAARDLVARLRSTYEQAVDAKYDTVEGTPEWDAADKVCGALLFDLVVAMQAAKCNGEEYFVNPGAPEEGTDIHHTEGYCPEHGKVSR